MINALQEVGKTHTIQIVLAYEGENVTATVIASPKGEQDDFTPPAKPIYPLNINGPIAEVEDYIKTKMGKDAIRAVELTVNIAALEERAETAEAKAKEAERKAANKVIKAGTTPPKPAAPVVKEPAKATVKLSEVKPGFKKVAAPAPVVAPQDDQALLDELAALSAEGGQT